MPAEAQRLTLCIFIDALGWRLQQRHGFLEDLLPYRSPLDTVLGYSSTCDPTILTGCMPRAHGHFAFFRYAPAASPFRGWQVLGLLPRWLTRRGRVRSLLSRGGRRVLGFEGYFQLYNVPFHVLPLLDYTERRDIYHREGIHGGQPTVFDVLGEHGVPHHLSDWRRPEEENLARLEREVEAGGIRFAYLYLAAMDATLHRHGTGAAQVAAKMAWYEQRLRHLVACARRRYRDVRLHLFSDHGMTDVTRVSDLMARVERLGARFGIDYAAVYDSTMARFWFFDAGARSEIAALLEADDGGRVLSPAQLAEYGCDFDDDRYGELFYLLDPGVLLCPSFMGETPLAAMHGYAPEDPDSVALYASSEAPDRPPRRLDDLHELMIRDAGVEVR